MERYTDLKISSDNINNLNRYYYSNNESVGFQTMAQREEYQKAFGRYLYRIIEEDYFNLPKIKVLEIGPRGVYFERGVHEEIQRLDQENGTDYGDRIEWSLFDISKVAINKARREYISSLNDFFPTKFFVGDAVNKNLPKGYDVIIANELIDDLRQMVLVNRGGRLYEIVYKIAVGDFINDVGIALRQSYLRPIKEEDKKEYFEVVSKYLQEDCNTTFFPDLDKFLANVNKASNPGAKFIIHDYMIVGGVEKDKYSIERVFGISDIKKVFEANPEEGLIQITADVNFLQLLDSLSKAGFAVKMIEEYDDFLESSLGTKRINKWKLDQVLQLTSKESIAEAEKLLRIEGDPASIEAKKKLYEALDVPYGVLGMNFYKSSLEKLNLPEETKEKIWNMYRSALVIRNPLLNITAVKY
ncbi:MAG: hypothetical protein ACP5NE_02765 [Candidatus Micrarchaeia archaeon]